MSGLEDRGKGKAGELKGKAKSRFGKATGDPGMRASGERDQVRGKAQGWMGKLKSMLARR